MTGTYSEEILNNLKKHDFNVEFSVLKHDYTIPVFYTKVKLIDKAGRAVEGIGFSDDEQPFRGLQLAADSPGGA